MKNIIRNTLITLCFIPSFAFAVEDNDGLTNGIQDNNTAATRSVFLQAEMLRTQREILTNLVVLNEQVAAQNKILLDIKANSVISEVDINKLKSNLPPQK